MAVESSGTDPALRLRHVIEVWYAHLPGEFAAGNPDARWDADYDWAIRFSQAICHTGFGKPTSQT